MKLRQVEKPGGDKIWWEIAERARQIQIITGFYYNRHIYTYDLFVGTEEAIDECFGGKSDKMEQTLGQNVN